MVWSRHFADVRLSPTAHARTHAHTHTHKHVAVYCVLVFRYMMILNLRADIESRSL